MSQVLLAGLGAFLLGALLVAIFYFATRTNRRIERLTDERDRAVSARQDLLASIPKLVREERAKALATSRHTIKGKVSEELLPILPGFPFQPSDCKFLGAPVDYLVFEGMSEDAVTAITFLEIKTGNASLSARQRQIRDCIASGRVTFREFNMAPAVEKEVA